MKRFLGMLLCLASAFMFFLITRQFLDPADMPDTSSKVETVVEKLKKQAGIKNEPPTKRESKVTIAPSRQADIPKALKSFFKNGGFNPSGKDSDWLLTLRFAQAGLSFPVSEFLKGTEIEVYPFPISPDSYVVTNLNSDDSMVLMMAKEGGRWKIDNVIPPTYHEAFLDMDITNWACNPLIDY